MKNIQSLLLDTETRKVKDIEEMVDCVNEENLNGYDYEDGLIAFQKYWRGILEK